MKALISTLTLSIAILVPMTSFAQQKKSNKAAYAYGGVSAASGYLAYASVKQRAVENTQIFYDNNIRGPVRKEWIRDMAKKLKTTDVLEFEVEHLNSKGKVVIKKVLVELPVLQNLELEANRYERVRYWVNRLEGRLVQDDLGLWELKPGAKQTGWIRSIRRTNNFMTKDIIKGMWKNPFEYSAVAVSLYTGLNAVVHYNSGTNDKAKARWDSSERSHNEKHNKRSVASTKSKSAVTNQQ